MTYREAKEYYADNPAMLGGLTRMEAEDRSTRLTMFDLGMLQSQVQRDALDPAERERISMKTFAKLNAQQAERDREQRDLLPK